MRRLLFPTTLMVSLAGRPLSDAGFTYLKTRRVSEQMRDAEDQIRIYVDKSSFSLLPTQSSEGLAASCPCDIAAQVRKLTESNRF